LLLNFRIPFVFGYLNDNLKKLSNGPDYGDGSKCPNDKANVCKALHNNGQDGKCIELTMLEIGWSRSKDKSIYGHLHQGYTKYNQPVFYILMHFSW
jgi:hypothetical protein